MVNSEIIETRYLYFYVISRLLYIAGDPLIYFVIFCSARLPNVDWGDATDTNAAAMNPESADATGS